MKYVPPVNGLPDESYVDRNPDTGEIGSEVRAAAIEHPMREIENVILEAGLVPNENDLTQLVTAIKSMLPPIPEPPKVELATTTRSGIVRIASDSEIVQGVSMTTSVAPAQIAKLIPLEKRVSVEYIKTSRVWTATKSGPIAVAIVGGGASGSYTGGDYNSGYAGGGSGEFVWVNLDVVEGDTFPVIVGGISGDSSFGEHVAAGAPSFTGMRGGPGFGGGGAGGGGTNIGGNAGGGASGCMDGGSSIMGSLNYVGGVGQNLCGFGFPGESGKSPSKGGASFLQKFPFANGDIEILFGAGGDSGSSWGKYNKGGGGAGGVVFDGEVNGGTPGSYSGAGKGGQGYGAGGGGRISGESGGSGVSGAGAQGIVVIYSLM